MIKRAVVAAVMVVSTGGGITAGRASAAPGDTSEPVAIVVEGGGYGHGRGMSQWGAYGWAVDHSWSWQQILDHYYGGTALGDAPSGAVVSVRLEALDGAAATGVVSATSWAVWNGMAARASLQAREVAPNTYDVWGNSVAACPSTSMAGWTILGRNITGPVTFSTLEDQSAAAASDVLGLCQPDGSVVHYRGTIRAANDSAGNNRTVNELLLENYLKGVISREVSTGWGNAAGGAGMNSLRAQAVAARSYALAQNRYAGQGGYATTCDSTTCQFYGGAARRTGPTAAVGGTSQVCESGNATFECANTNRAITETSRKIRVASGHVVATEYSASNGPRTAGGTFPAVDDAGDDVPGNPNHRWTRVLDADTVMSRFGLGAPVAAATERDPASIYDGVWANRVRLQGTGGTQVISNASLRSTYGFPSSGFTVRIVRRDAVLAHSLAMIGDSVGLSVTEPGSGELPTVLDRVFGSARYDAVVNRCTIGCGTNNGLVAAQAVPIGTSLVVVELGYNDGSAPFADRIDQVMAGLRARSVRRVLWVNMANRSGRYAAANQALAAAPGRWPELQIADWDAASTGSTGNRARWFGSDGVHLSSTGQAQFALFLRDRIVAAGRTISVKVTPGTTLRVPVTGTTGVPSGAVAAMWNVTVTQADRAGWATVWPCGSPQPNASNLNFAAGVNVANAVIAGLDGTGEVCVASSAPAHVVIDAGGAFGYGYQPVTPARLADTRPTGRPVQPGAPLRVPVLGRGGLPDWEAAALAMNLTVVAPAANGYATVWPCDTPMPGTSNINFVAGVTVANSVVTSAGSSGDVCVDTSTPVHVVVDASGSFSGPATASTPVRLLDTRSGGRLVAADAVTRVRVAGAGGVPSSGARAVVLNLTTVKPTSTGFVTAWACGSPRPATSNVNAPVGRSVTNLAIVAVDATGEVCVASSSATHLVVDAGGWFGTVARMTAPTRIVDTRAGVGPMPT